MSLKIGRAAVDGFGVRALRAITIATLVFFLFTGIAYALTPVLTDGWGNTTTTVIGVVLAVGSAVGLRAVDTWRALPWVQDEDGPRTLRH